MAKKMMEHECTDGITYRWVGRKEKPVSCPRCKGRLDFSQKEKDEKNR